MSDARIAKAKDRIEEVAASFSGELGVAACRLAPGGSASGRSASAGETIERLADEVFPPASLIKLPILVEVLRQCEAGRLDLVQRVALHDRDKATGSGILFALDAGLEPSVRDLALLMIAVSDNTATNLLMDLAGREAINAGANALGLTQTYLTGKLQVPRELWTEEQKAGRRATTTPADMLRLLVALERRKGVSDWVAELALAIMGRQQLTQSLTRLLPHDDEGIPTVSLEAKSGSINGVRNQVAIARGDGFAYAVAIMTKGCRDLRWNVDNEGERVIAEVSASLFEAFGGG